MVVVRHGNGYYNLYISDESGVKYSLSREYILSNETLVWGKSITLVDIHRVSATVHGKVINFFLPSHVVK